MVFEALGPSLYDFLKRQQYQPFPISCVQDFARQLLETLEFLHSFRLIHTDLKPENILLLNAREVPYKAGYNMPESTRIKVIDFGGATYDNEKKSSIVNTRQYRAPEVILGVGWSMPSDLWSIGKWSNVSIE
jgi:serine/threonine protein kinase